VGSFWVFLAVVVDSRAGPVAKDLAQESEISPVVSYFNLPQDLPRGKSIFYLHMALEWVLGSTSAQSWTSALYSDEAMTTYLHMRNLTNIISIVSYRIVSGGFFFASFWLGAAAPKCYMRPSIPSHDARWEAAE
jgi:hypothetical protein